MKRNPFSKLKMMWKITSRLNKLQDGVSGTEVGGIKVTSTDSKTSKYEHQKKKTHISNRLQKKLLNKVCNMQQQSFCAALLLLVMFICTCVFNVYFFFLILSLKVPHMGLFLFMGHLWLKR